MKKLKLHTVSATGSFCSRCGAERILGDPPLYDQRNGQRIGTERCPNLQCQRGCSAAGHVRPGRAWLPGVFGGNPYCLRCGDVVLPEVWFI